MECTHNGRIYEISYKAQVLGYPKPAVRAKLGRSGSPQTTLRDRSWLPERRRWDRQSHKLSGITYSRDISSQKERNRNGSRNPAWTERHLHPPSLNTMHDTHEQPNKPLSDILKFEERESEDPGNRLITFYLSLVFIEFSNRLFHLSG
jgi:hypothetical protein